MSVNKCKNFNYNCPYYEDYSGLCLDIENKCKCAYKIDYNKQLNHEEITVELVKHLKRIEKQNSDLLNLLRQKQK